MQTLGWPRGESLDLDFHTIPFPGEDALLQKHCVSKRSRRQKGLLAFVAQDAHSPVFCYGNAQVRKANQREIPGKALAFHRGRMRLVTWSSTECCGERKGESLRLPSKICVHLRALMAKLLNSFADEVRMADESRRP